MQHTESKICAWPWVGFNVQANGKLTVCPASWSSASKGFCKDEKGRVFTAQDRPIDSYRNSKTLTDVRRKMLSGELPEEVCSRCIREEAAGMLSARQRSVVDPAFQALDVRSLTDRDGKISLERVPVQNLDIRFGNRCNLMCRMCSPISSHKWYAEWYKTKGSSFTDGIDRYQLEPNASGVVVNLSADYEWYESSEIWDFLQKNGDKISRLHFTGGEPLLIEPHFDLLQNLNKIGTSGNITLSYNTNLTYLPQKAIDLWKQFKRVEVAVSLDGLYELNDYIRYPSEFKNVYKNLQILDETPDNIIYWINTTVQLLNAYNIFELWSWILHSPFKKINQWMNDGTQRHFFLSHIPLSKPEIFSITAMNKTARESWLARKAEFLSYAVKSPVVTRIDEDNAKRGTVLRIQQVANGYESILNNEDRSHLLQQAKVQLGVGDEFRKQNVKKVIPDLYKDLYGAF